MEKRRPRVRDVVIFHDSKGNAHSALLKIVWDQSRAVKDESGEYVLEEDGQNKTEPLYASDDLSDLPCVNLVYVSDDPNRGDSCGRQTIVETSVPHKGWGGDAAVHGFYWRFDWEEPTPYRAPSDA